MREVSIEGGGYYIPKLAQALLQCDNGTGGESGRERQLLCWGKVGRALHRQVPPGQQHEDVEDDAELHVRTSILIGNFDSTGNLSPAAGVPLHC
jgi:hypothetical protein